MPVSPKGKFKWAKLFTPEKKFENQEPHGVYSIDLILSKEDAAPMQKLLKEMDDAHFKKSANEALVDFRKNNGGKPDKFKDGLAFAKAKELKRKPIPGKPYKDENLEETGEIIFTFSEVGKWQKKDKKTGDVIQEWDMKPEVVDAKRRPWDESQLIGHDSEGKVQYEIKPHNFPTIGVSTKLRKVQVINLVEYHGGGEKIQFDDEASEEALETAEELFNEESDVPL